MSKLQKKPAAHKRGHPTLQNMNFYKFLSTFVGHFCPPGSGSGFRIRIRIPNTDPDPQTRLNTDPKRIRIRIHNPAAIFVLVREAPFYFCGPFLPSWIRIRIHNLNADPDPATQINADPCGSGSETLAYTMLRASVFDCVQQVNFFNRIARYFG